MHERAAHAVGLELPAGATGRWRSELVALALLCSCGSSGGKGSATDDGASGAGGSGTLLSGPNGSAGSSAQPASGEGPHIGGCAVFPADNAWNRDVSGLPLRANSDAIIDAIGREDRVHPDFGTEWEGAPIGIPFVTVSGAQARVPIEFTAYGDESDPGPYPVPRDAPVEGGSQGDGDRHVLVVDTDACMLYELYRAFPGAGGAWSADSGAVFDLSRNDEHPLTWTSADAAGLPILPGLVRYDEVVTEGALHHAVRFTVSRSRRAIVAPARHHAGSSDASDLPPMGLRLRMKQSFSCGGFSPPAQVVCAGLKRYGLIVADNGSDWYLSGAPDARWDDDAIGDLKTVTGNAFEVVDTGPIETY
ncbi:MAG: hypothetical protein RL033_4772 [Pseudomonadota bacterium]|jgi:hypothetical protein